MSFLIHNSNKISIAYYLAPRVSKCRCIPWLTTLMKAFLKAISSSFNTYEAYSFTLTYISATIVTRILHLEFPNVVVFPDLQHFWSLFIHLDLHFCHYVTRILHLKFPNVVVLPDLQHFWRPWKQYSVIVIPSCFNSGVWQNFKQEL